MEKPFLPTLRHVLEFGAFKMGIRKRSAGADIFVLWE